MKVKVLAAAVILSVAVAANIHAFGFGAQLNFMAAKKVFAPGASLVVSPTETIHSALNWYMEKDDVNIIGLTVDMVPLNLEITQFSVGILYFTLGGGLFTNIVLGDDDFGFNVGMRLPIGLSFRLMGHFEIYTHIAPSIGVDFAPNLEFSTPFVPIALGLRFWTS